MSMIKGFFSFIIRFILAVFKYHKRKVLLVIVSALLFFVLFFPYGDLSGLITRQVLVRSGNQVFLNFGGVDLNLIPPSLSLEKVSVETPKFPPLEFDQLLISLSISKLLAFQISGDLLLKGLWGGDIGVKGDLSNVDGAYFPSHLELELERVLIEEFIGFALGWLKTPIELSGEVQGQVQVTVKDPSLSEQPSGELNLKIKNLKLPTSISTSIGPMVLPELTFSELHLKSRLAGGKLVIDDEGVFGQASEPIYGKFKGSIDFQLGRSGQQLKFDPKKYKLKVDMSVKKAMERELSLFLSFISQFKTATDSASRYLFKVSANNMKSPPSLDSINKL